MAIRRLWRQNGKNLLKIWPAGVIIYFFLNKLHKADA
jgi:hypothetical protein